jgi:hypothetical protein
LAAERLILTAVYHILRTPETAGQDLGGHDFDECHRQAAVRREIRRFEAMGDRVRVKPRLQAV